MSWKGYYEQYGQKHPMNFSNFHANPSPGGLIQGTGTDEVGEFTFNGSFNQNATMVRFSKAYKGAHTIYYQGDVQQNPPAIRGFWGF